jgi:hypothetical protein
MVTECSCNERRDILKQVAFVASLPLRFVRAALVIITSPQLLFYCLIPWAIGLVSFIVFFWLAVEFRETIGGAIFDVSSGWLQSIISWSCAQVSPAECSLKIL